MNPCTGPIGIEDAAPGDTLRVTIDAIRLTPRGYVAALPGTGILGDQALDPGLEPFDVCGESVRFAGRVSLPARPMVGTIGVAPAVGSIITLSLGDHGGNLDFNEITPAPRCICRCGFRAHSSVSATSTPPWATAKRTRA